MTHYGTKKIVFKRYESQEALLEAHRDAEDHRFGPVLKYAGREFVQIYLGQHEWIAICLEDPEEFHADPGWEGTRFGWVYLDRMEAELWHRICTTAADWKVTPERDGKPVTGDQLLLADERTLAGYLGPDDPLLKSEPT